MFNKEYRGSRKIFVLNNDVMWVWCYIEDTEMDSTTPSKLELCSVIKFLTAEHCSAADIHWLLRNVYRETNGVSLRTMERWQKRFQESCTSVDDDKCEGRMSINEAKHCMRALLAEDRCLTITDLQTQMAADFLHEASHGTIHKALTKHLKMWKVCAQWVPRQLTPENRERRMVWSF